MSSNEFYLLWLIAVTSTILLIRENRKRVEEEDRWRAHKRQYESAMISSAYELEQERAMRRALEAKATRSESSAEKATFDRPIKLEPLTGSWKTQCCACGKQYDNGCGSSECCGALQTVISQ